MQRGSIVKQVVKTVEGTVTGFQVDQETGDKLVEVTWTDASGQVSSRFFKEADLQVVTQ